MQITSIDSSAVNTDTSDIVLTFKERTRAPAQPLRLSTSLRSRAGLPPAREGATFDALRQDFLVAKRRGSSLSKAEFNRLVYSLFAPSNRERVLSGIHDDYPVALTNRAVITSFGEVDFAEWQGTFEFADPIWREVELQESGANPLEVGGTYATWPVIDLPTGDECTRQHLTVWDRTGHGVGSLLIAVTPAEDWPEDNYMIHFEGTPQFFAKVDGRLQFRIGVQADTLPSFIDIHMGEHIDGSQYAGRLERFGITVDADIPNWRYSVSTETVRDNGLAPALAWQAAVTGDPPPRRRYSFGMVDEWIHLRDDNVAEDEQGLGNDVDGLTILTGVEADRITDLSLEVRTGHQPAQSGSSGSGLRRRVMRCTLKIDANLGEHYAQWSLGPVTFPRTYSEQRTSRSVSQDGPTLQDSSQQPYRVTTNTSTAWYRIYSVAQFVAAVRRYFPSINITQGAEGVFFLDFGEVDHDIQLMGMSVHPVVRNSTTQVQRDVSDTLTGVRRSAAASWSSSSMRGGDVPGIFWESVWVDPTTLRPFEEDPATANLLPYAIHGQARISVVYWRRDSPHPIPAWSQVVTSGNGPRTTHFNNLSIETPGAVQIAVRLEPVAARHAYANWGQFRVTSIPTIHLNEDRVPDLEISEAIDSRMLHGSLVNLTTLQALRLEHVLVDAPGLRINTGTGAITPISGIGEPHGKIASSAGSTMLYLDHATDNEWSVTGNLDAEDITWSWNRRVAL